MKTPVPALTLVLSLAACGGSSDPGLADRYFPMQTGASWEYQINNNGTIGTKTQVVLGLEDVGGAKAGIEAYKVQSNKPSGKTTISWQEDTGSSLIRHREQTFAVDQTQLTDEFYLPGKLRLDESSDHLVLDASFVDAYDEEIQDLIVGGAPTTVSKSETWTVEAVDASVTVPAGTFDCIQLHKFNAGTGSDKRYWFAAGVGKIREQAAGGVTEELVSYSVP